MRIVFMGTPDFAYVPLNALIESNRHDVVAVITQPDKANTRGRKIVYSPVKALAIESKLDILQPANIKNIDAINAISKLNPDIVVVVAYGQLLPLEILNMPKYGCINIHASLLPRYRGSAPIHWSIINGEVETGVTTMYMDQGMDTGDIIYQEKVKIGDQTTVGELYEELAVLGTNLLLKTLADLETGTAPRKKQDEKLSSYAPLLTKDMARINWNNTTSNIINLIRGTNPWPVAYTHYHDQKVKIYTAKSYESPEEIDYKPGTIIRYEKNKGLLIKTMDSSLYLQVIQFSNKKRMHIDDYLKGNTIEIGHTLD
ncbi:methionyl-tRNA formyltransferase [Alkalibaculum sp. M08DMB]|uniref:Methionyl-tRNA formyltransferase n=1 Tax=Alkalibaculum sporogenes TaxID=2655001 RepID=A0A6A7K9P8_9FIRM|nr:methionyl-tRNA formyltransferase [Alkalibaculum sporogenes]MPW26031.1 methionyl-tRNA formyltransferase [Alkalibaculum sporogenes]